MKPHFLRPISLVAALAMLGLASPAAATESTAEAQSHDHHGHSHADAAERIHEGYFDDDQIAARELSDWQGDWQSVYPLLKAGNLDPVMAHKAAHGDKSAKEYRT